ncbi:MAG: U32 family peptidase [Methanobacterium sp.]
MKIEIPELLAPAGSMESLKAAVNAGADAVYLAGKQFGARHYAANFDNTDLKEAVHYAHLRGVKVYVTVNTLIKDHELPDLAKYLLFLYESGVDAILVQDMGVARIAKELVPDLNLHASTQMTIHNTEGVKWAAEFGFKRAVLAREMKLAEIEEINKNIEPGEIELEIFAHGALCYSYSGQCLLSSFIGGRSGNRGMCAQPCRKPYDLILGEKDEYGRPINTTKVEIMQSIIKHQKSKIFEAKIKEKYLLSTRDLAIYEHLDKISKSSVSSLKIEGRMRSPEYVAVVVSTYRKALDSIKKGRWKPRKKDIDDLKLAFNRDFTGGYLLEKDESSVMSRDRPGNRGVYVGSVTDYKKKDKEAVIEIKNQIIPEKGDGIVFINKDQNKNEYGMVIHESPHIYKNKAKFTVQRPLKPGTLVYITRRKSLLDKAQKILSDDKHQIKIDLDIFVENNGSISLQSKFNAPDNALIELELVPDFKMEAAVKKPVNEKIIEAQFRKTGGTPFDIKNMNIHYPGGFFAPVSELNKLRRELFEKIEEKLISASCPSKNKMKEAHDKLNKLLPQLDIKANNIKLDKKSISLAVYADDLDILKGAASGKCDRIYFDPFTENATLNCNSNLNTASTLNLINESVSICKNTNTELILKLPKITSSYYLASLNSFLAKAFNSGISGVMTDSIGAAEFMLNLNSQINLFASAGLNIWNYKSVEELQNIFKNFTVSPELSKDEIKKLAFNIQTRGIDSNLELLVQGNLESIVSKDCIPHIAGDKVLKNKNAEKSFLGIEDTKNHLFPIRLDNECRTHILNSVELCLVDYMPQISKIGIDTVIIDARGRTPKYAHEMSHIYKKAIEIGAKKDQKSKRELNALKNKVKKISLGGITTGNFLRGVTEQ